MKRNKSTVDGPQLVADFQSAYIAIATSEVVKTEAENAEADLLQNLTHLSGGGYLNPGTIDSERQNDVSRASLDAHIKKIQAQQVEVMKSVQVSSLDTENQALYIGRKVQIDVLPGAQPPIDGLWFSSQTGYRSNILNKKRVTGTIKELSLDKNMLVIKPSLMPKLLNSELKAYLVYVINPETAEPAINITFI